MATETGVEAISTLRLRCAQKPRQWTVAFNSRYHALPSSKMPRARNGMFSTRNAGATAIPVETVPIDPSTAGMTHHQGRGRIGAITRSSSFSIRNGFSIRCLREHRKPARQGESQYAEGISTRVFTHLRRHSPSVVAPATCAAPATGNPSPRGDEITPRFNYLALSARETVGVESRVSPAAASCDDYACATPVVDLRSSRT